MRIDRDTIKQEIKEAFRNKGECPTQIWAYAESYDTVMIGTWDGNDLVFYKDLDEKLLLTLRVFNETRELRFSNTGIRNTDIYKNINSESNSEVPEQYYMYGENAKKGANGYTELWEQRGGTIHFPGDLSFPNGIVALKLGIKNYVRYNPVIVCPKDEEHDYGLNTNGVGAIEVIDYAYTGFYYTNGEAVKYEQSKNQL
ncbi:MAG: CRISPR-associated protein Csx19 [Peptococcaceae bacterium]|nr:CRISPR-associated protein Csx19 [Peptococcaceae bacterium]